MKTRVAGVGGIILAAGQSRRFDGDKRQALLPSGETLLSQTIRQTLRSIKNLIVVLRADDEVLESELDKTFPDVSLHRAVDSALGMGHSLAAGIKCIDDWSGVLIFLADMPYIKPSTIEIMLDRDSNDDVDTKSILIPHFKDKPGHPVLFPRHYFNQLTRLKGDQGARSVIKANHDQVKMIDVDDPAIHFDIDAKITLDLRP